MGIKGVMEVEVEINCHGDIFHEIFTKRPHHVSTMSPSKIHACDVHEGDFGKPGSIVNWNYTFDGKKCVAKEIIEAVDIKNKLVRYKVIEGDLLKEYKSFTIIVHVIPKDKITGVKWIIEFEKIHDEGPYPTKFLDYCISVIKDIEAHHLKT